MNFITRQHSVLKACLTVNIRILIMTLLVISVTSTLRADDSRTLRLFNDREILSHQYRTFCLDKQGYLWIGSDLGLVKFDGSDYDVFRHDGDTPGSISSNLVLDILCDSKGRIWVATADGMNLYDVTTNSFKTVKIPGISFKGYILSISEQADGSIAFIVSGVGFYIVDDPVDGILEAVRVGYVPEHSDINSLVATPDGGFLCGSHYGNIVRIMPNGKMTSKHATNDFFIGIRRAGENHAIAYTSKDIWRINFITMEIDEIDISLLDGHIINNISIGPDNTAYVATNSGGIWIIKENSNRLQSMEGLFHPLIDINRIKLGAIYMAPDGNLWIGCNHHGVLMLPSNPMPFSYHPLKRTMSDFDGGITAMSVAPEGIWMALEDNEIVNFTNDHKLRHRHHISKGRSVCQLHMADDGTLYAASVYDAIYRIDPSNGAVSRLFDLTNTSIRYCMAGGGSDSDLYIGIHGDGVIKYDLSTGKKTMFSSKQQGEDRFLNDWIASLFIDSHKRLWIGLYSGLACYDIPTDTFRIIRKSPFFSLGACNAIRETRDGRLLIGTSCGLAIYNIDNDTVENIITSTHGLCDNDIRTLEIDSDDVAWIGTLHGLSRYSIATGDISSLKGGHGISETIFLHSGYDRDSDRMVFAGNLGYTMFSPSTIGPVTFSRPVNVSGIYLNGHRLTESHLSGGRPAIETDSSHTYHRVNLSYNDNNLMLRLSTMDFRDPANVNYEWKIEGEGNSWITTRPGSSNIVIPGLDSGNHTLLVRASDNSVKSDITRFTIHVTPPWYLSAPAKIVYALIFIGVIVLIFIIVRKKKNEEINEAKVKFFMDISHEIRSPVTCIIGPLETLIKKDHDPETQAMLRGMHRNAGRILSLANQLLEIRKIDKGKKSLTMQPTDLTGFAAELVELYRPMAESKSIDISLDAPADMEQVWIDRDNFDKVLVNLITNAIKYTPDGGKVEVCLDTTVDEELGNCARIRVIDTGIGIDPKHISRIFERFYQGQRSAAGFGVGLNLARQLVILHHGSLTAANRPDGVKGSIFTVTLPLGNSHLSTDEVNNNMLTDGILPPGDISASINLNTDSSYKSSQAPRRNTDRYTILIVDDDNELREYLKFHFSRIYKVLEASNGSEALKLMLDNRIDLVISDVVMPGVDGLELLKTIKSNTETSHTPVILLSSRNDVADRLTGWNRGADGYIGKPFSISELESLVDTLIENRLRMKGKFSGAQNSCDNIPLPEVKGNDETLMNKIVKVIEARIADPDLNVETLGVEVGISRAHLHRKMKEMIGMTPSDFIRNVRLRRACEILRKHDVDVTQVAYKVGFTSQPHFSTAFKKFTGVSPTEYRARSNDRQDD